MSERGGKPIAIELTEKQIAELGTIIRTTAIPARLIESLDTTPNSVCCALPLRVRPPSTYALHAGRTLCIQVELPYKIISLW